MTSKRLGKRRRRSKRSKYILRETKLQVKHTLKKKWTVVVYLQPMDGCIKYRQNPFSHVWTKASFVIRIDHNRNLITMFLSLLY